MTIDLQCARMNKSTRNTIAEALENLATQKSWSSAVWQRCYNLVLANWDEDEELMEFVQHDLINYDDMFHPRRILGFQLKSDFDCLDDYRHDFCAVAAALRANMSLMKARRRFCFRSEHAQRSQDARYWVDS